MRASLAPVLERELSPLDVAVRALEIVEEVRAVRPVLLDVASVTDVARYFLIVGARSDRQVEGITNRVIDELSSCGVELEAVEGLGSGQWAIADFGDLVIHVFYEPVREHYNLEGLWFRAKRVNVEGTNSAPL